MALRTTRVLQLRCRAAHTLSKSALSQRNSPVPPPEAAVKTLAPKAFATGVLAGCGGTLVGMGGAFVTIPVLTSRWIRLTQHQAQATSLAGVVATGAGGAFAFACSGCVDWPIALAITGGGVATAGAGASLAAKLPGNTMKGMLGAFMIVSASAVMLKSRLLCESEEPTGETQERDSLDLVRIAKLLSIGGGVGIFAGMFGVGGGAISVPAVALCFPELSHREALGTSCAAMILPAVCGLIRHAKTGVLVIPAAIPLAIGTMAGAIIGGRYIVLQLDEHTLRMVFSGLLAVLGARSIQSAWSVRSLALQAVAK